MFKFILQILVALSELLTRAEESRLAGQQATQFMVPVIPVQALFPEWQEPIQGQWLDVTEVAIKPEMDCRNLSEEDMEFMVRDWAYWDECNIPLVCPKYSVN